MSDFIAVLLAGITDGATYGLIALGIVLVYKATRVINFAQAEIGTIALYFEWQMTELGVPVYVALVVVLVLAAFLGVAVERVLRPLTAAPRLTVTVATLGIATVLGAYQVIQFGATPHLVPEIISSAQPAFILVGVPVTWADILALIVSGGIAFALYTFFKRTVFGLGVLASAQDQTALRLMGLPLNRVLMFTWASGAVLTAVAAAIVAPTIGTLTPFFMTTVTIAPLAAALVGGLTSLPGAFVGGIAVALVENGAKTYFPSVSGAEFVATFSLILAVLVFRPRGLLGAEA